ncbi:pentapeptide repeat-containing protein [Methyloceanibacter methanicus]|uniref:pentapeptide repeat-containing protein n=1 Tax=Methyloceanibacter methanicus TaxID=1774968 RepID=UPI003CC7A3E8
MVKTRFNWAKLPGAQLDGADVTGADFSNADLEGATVSGLKGVETATGFPEDVR